MDLIPATNITTMSSRDAFSKTLGHVYVVESADGRSVKIGRSINPNQRTKTIKNQANASGRVWISPVQLDSHALEAVCHKHHSRNRLHGEWFSVSFDVAVQTAISCLGVVPHDWEICELKAKKRNRSRDLMDLMSEYQLIPTEEQVVMKNAFETARLIRDVIVVQMVDPEPDYQPSDELHGISRFELLVAIYVSTADREGVASLFHEAVVASGSNELRVDLLNELSACALLDAKNAGIQPSCTGGSVHTH